MSMSTGMWVVAAVMMGADGGDDREAGAPGLRARPRGR
jgi:hypothetical protein